MPLDFLRDANERARLAVWLPSAAQQRGGYDPVPGRAAYANLRHGDILFVPDEMYITTAFVVLETNAGKRLGQVDEIEDAVWRLTRRTTAAIADPVAFYRGCRGVIPLERIDLDPDAHRAALEDAAGRPVHDSREVWWSTSARAFRIRSPRSPDLSGGRIAVTLDRSTPVAYLGPGDFLDVDPSMEAARAHNKELYEVKAHALFLAMPADTILGISVMQGGHRRPDRSAPFAGVETDPEQKGRVTAVCLAMGCGAVAFTPRVIADSGPFGGVAVWASDAHLYANGIWFLRLNGELDPENGPGGGAAADELEADVVQVAASDETDAEFVDEELAIPVAHEEPADDRPLIDADDALPPLVDGHDGGLRPLIGPDGEVYLV